MNIPNYAMRQEKKRKGIYTGKKERKLSLFTDIMIVYVENLKESEKKLLEPISSYNQIAGYKVNITKVNCFLVC